MHPTWTSSGDEDEAYTEVLSTQPYHLALTTPHTQTKPRRAKRRKTNTGKAAAAKHRATRASTSLSGLLDALQHGLSIRLHTAPASDSEAARHETASQGENVNLYDGFESTMEGLLPEYLEARQVLWAQAAEVTLPVRLMSAYARYHIPTGSRDCRCLCSRMCFGGGFFFRSVRTTARV